MRHRGFTLIELLVGLAIVVILILIGMPALNQSLDSSRLKAAATSFSSGLQYARSQAVSRNEPVRFMSELNGAAVSAGWAVATLAAPATILQSRSRNEGAATRVNVAANAGFVGVQFNGLGAATLIDAAGTAVVANPGIFAFTSPEGACAANGGTVRCLDVRLTPGGQIRLCDPAAAASDTRAC